MENISMHPYDERDPFERHEHRPKMEATFKKMKYRHYHKGNGFLNKLVFWENYPYLWYLNNDYHQLEQQQMKVSDSGEMGLPESRVFYSQGKKKRWEIARQLKEEVPEPEYLTTSTSVVELVRNRTQVDSDNMPKAFVLYNDWTGCQLRKGMRMGFNSGTKEWLVRFSFKTKNGEELTRTGKFDSKLPTTPSNGSDKAQLHVEYQILDFEMNYKLHNSFKFRRFDRQDRRYPREAESCRLRFDVVQGVMGQWKSGERERAVDNWRCTTDLPDPHDFEDDEEQELSQPTGLSFGDFLPVELPRKIGKNRPRCLSESWDLVSND